MLTLNLKSILIENLLILVYNIVEHQFFRRSFMLYKRQKFLLSFLNIFGGELSRINCQKLIFLYSQYNNKDYYDFFPYKFGPFSNTLFDDKRSLSNKGILHESENFLVNYDHFSSDNCIDFRERMLITQFKDSVEGIRGQKLIKNFLLTLSIVN